ncbi:organic cation transporter protein [Drosophila takahashii]|uniref:organic cation transporter protein n=1 Tax=Drosophila takahashii TaxID=29030 RepID=UPI001CF80D06|nr:organic cation transporter protein [Drosophila takahashii]XP_017007192.2 organic cation transporter protein [Drosophila takahashii]
MQVVRVRKNTMLEVDKILEKCGDFSRLQMLLFCLINVLSALHYYSQTIISFVPKYWCADGLPASFEPPAESSCLPLNRNSTSSNTCYSYDYELYMGYQSFPSEMDWVCEDAWKLTLGQSMFFVGSVVGSMVLGYLADLVGRLPILIVANLIAMTGNLLTIWSTNVTLFCIFRMISGIATDSNFVMMYILVMEYMRPSVRTLGLSICIGLFYCLGSMAAPWIAVLMRSWHGFLLVTSLPLLVVPFFYFIVPESIQWLISKQKYDRAVVCLKRVAKINGRQVEESAYEEFVEECKFSQQNQKASPHLFDLFKTPRLRRNTLILFFKSMVITLCYDAVSRNVQGLGISPFLMFSLSATAILPACLLIIALQDRIGRKAMASASLLLSGIFISVTGGIIFAASASDKTTTLLVSLSVVGRFGVTVAYNSGAQYATELIPTCVRGQGVAAVHVAGYAFTFFSAYILYTRCIFSPLPEIILGVLSLLGACLCLLLPETLHRTLPTSLEDGENFGKNDRWYTFSFLEKRTQSAATLDTQNVKMYSHSTESNVYF